MVINMSNIEIMNLEITSICNYKCPICVKPARSGLMCMDEFYKIVNKNYHLFNENGVWLHFCGEPLTSPNLLKCVRYIKSMGAKVRLSTNGALLKENRWHELATSGLDYIVVSISTLDREIYKKIHGVDNFSLVLENILGFKQYIDYHKIPVQLQAVMIDIDNSSDFEKFTKYFHSYGINTAFHQFTNRANNVKMDFHGTRKHDYTVKRDICQNLEKRICILSDCEVVTCTCDFEGQNSLGNLREYDYSLEKLIENGKLDELQTRLKNQVYLGTCANCSDWIYYQEGSVEKYVTVFPVAKSEINSFYSS